MPLEMGNWCTGVCDWRELGLLLGKVIGLWLLVTGIHAASGSFFSWGEVIGLWLLVTRIHAASGSFSIKLSDGGWIYQWTLDEQVP